MSFMVKSLGCTAGRQLASRLSSSTHASVGCEAIAGGGCTHAVAGETHLAIAEKRGEQSKPTRWSPP